MAWCRSTKQRRSMRRRRSLYDADRPHLVVEIWRDVPRLPWRKDKVSLSFNALPGAVGYVIYRSWPSPMRP